MKVILKALAAASVLALGLGAAQAETATNGLEVQITIKDGCTVNFPTGAGVVNFGDYAAITQNLTATRPVVVNCKNATTTTAGGQYSLALNAGSSTGATIATRKLTNTSDSTKTINYQVYQAQSASSTACSGTVWGDGTTGSTFSGPLSVTAGNVTNYFTVCIPALTSTTQPTNGVYSDVLTATLTY